MSGSKHKNATSFKPGQSGNPNGRIKGIERMTREEVEAFTWEDDELGLMTGWKALRRRAWLLAMRADPKEAIRYMQWLDARAHGQPKQSLEVAAEVTTNEQTDWATIPLERRVQLLELAEAAGLLDGDISTEH